MDRNIAAEFLSLLLYSAVAWYLNPLIAHAFQSGLSNPAFASSPAGVLWGLMAGFFDFQLDIVVAWILWLVSLVT